MAVVIPEKKEVQSYAKQQGISGDYPDLLTNEQVTLSPPADTMVQDLLGLLMYNTQLMEPLAKLRMQDLFDLCGQQCSRLTDLHLFACPDLVPGPLYYPSRMRLGPAGPKSHKATGTHKQIINQCMDQSDGCLFASYKLGVEK